MRYGLVTRCASTALLALTLASALAAQQPTQRSPEQIRALYEQHQGDFDYLLGDWSFTSESKEWGKVHGIWSAVRLPEGAQILDEYRVIGDSGQTWYVTHTLRAYNAADDRWDLVSVEPGSGLLNVGTARRVGQEVHLEQKFGVGGPNPSLWRIRYYNIRPDGFSWRADRSTDGGTTWVHDHLRIEARRVGAPRSLEALAIVRSEK